MVQPECDLLHPHYTQPPESDCVTPVNACAWPDAWGATPAGMQSVTHTETADSISVSWAGEFLAGDQFMDPVHSYMVGLFQGTGHTIVQEVPLPLSRTSYTFSGLAPGEYDVGIAEISDAGRSPYDGPMWLVLPPSSSPSGPATTPSPR